MVLFVQDESMQHLEFLCSRAQQGARSKFDLSKIQVSLLQRDGFIRHEKFVKNKVLK